MKPSIILSLCFIMVSVTGCVTGRRSFDLSVPSMGTDSSAVIKGTVLIGKITDDRHFENKPSSPSTPSVDGDVSQLSSSTKNALIGRQRNTFGMALGDIVLPEGENVQGKVAALLTEGLKQSGYSITATSAEGNSVSAEIEQFWEWMTPGAIALTFEAKITCRIEVFINGKHAIFHVNGYGLNHGQVARDGNWQKAYTIAYKDFLSDLAVQLKDAGL